jgi:Uma2 family endonuclease
MILANDSIEPSGGHIVLEDVSWEFYEHLLEEIGDGHLRVTYDQGRMEIMSPLFKHEKYGYWIARLIDLVCEERGIRYSPAGSTTFKSPAQRKGLEPDTCFYIPQTETTIKLDGKFDAAVDPAPDLAIEVDITRRHVPRQPIYAALGIREIWCFDGDKLHVLHLSRGKYVERAKSKVFPFLPMDEFAKYVVQMNEKDQLETRREFRQWVRELPVEGREAQ